MPHEAVPEVSKRQPPLLRSRVIKLKNIWLYEITEATTAALAHIFFRLTCEGASIMHWLKSHQRFPDAQVMHAAWIFQYPIH